MPITLSAAYKQADQGKLSHQPSRPSNRVRTSLLLTDYLRALQPFGTRKRYTRNETIFREGDPADQVYKVMSGTVRICRHLPDGRRHVNEFMFGGDLMGFLECADHPACAEAVTDVTLISYPRAGFDRLASSNPAVRSRVLCHLSANFLEAQHHLFVLGCQRAKERVASFFLRTAERNDVFEGDRLELTMGRQDIADHLGLTIEAVCRAITALKDDGAIAVPNTHQIIVTDMRGLRTLAVED